MKSSIFGLLFFSNIASGLTSVVSRDYKMFRSGATWNDAQTFCKQQFTGLATIYKQSNLTILNPLWYFAWIDPRGGVDSALWLGGTTAIIDITNCAAVQYVDSKVCTQPCEMKLFFICQSIDATVYKFIPDAMTWNQAQAYCINQGKGQLVKLGTNNVNEAVKEQNFPIWTGLQRNGNSWSYISGYSPYTPWAYGEPSANGNCASINAVTMDLASQDCGISLPFICITENVFLVKENKSWEEALQYCRGLTSSTNSSLRFDLLSVEPGEEQDYVMNKVLEASSKEAWTGLHFLAGEWLWVNGARVLYSDLPVCPLPTQHCGVLSINYPGTVVAKDCVERKNFFCYSY
ncbi:putative LOC107381851-like protein [Nothobranchius furzeri]|uniref:LOC107381851-like protein n=2 Tax=Nothobranchius furzeri TaxID=105023 RepID=A0A9D2Y1S0_NOTFU|nr:putative LOC107381851-like protein [Nothobranchius furzeri]